MQRVLLPVCSSYDIMKYIGIYAVCFVLTVLGVYDLSSAISLSLAGPPLPGVCFG